MNGQPRLVDVVTLRGLVGFLLLSLNGLVFILTGKEALCAVSPRAEVVLVKGHEVPLLEVHPFVARFDGAAVAIHTEEVLERAEAYDGAGGVALLVGHTVTGDELPAFKVDVALKVLAPGILNGRLEGKHQYALHIHTAGKLVGGKGLAKAHLGIPQELGYAAVTGLLAHAEIRLGLVDRCKLFGTHCEVLGALALVTGAITNLQPCATHVIRRAAEPLATDILKSLGLKPFMHRVVHKRRTIGAHRAFGKHDLVRLALARLDDGELLGHALLDIDLGIADLKELGMVRVFVAVRVDRRVNLRTLGEEGTATHCCHPSPWDGSSTR